MSTDRMEDIVDAHIADINEDRQSDGCFHPSSMWSCSRQAVMSARGEKQTNPPNKQTLRVFRVGSLLHLEFQAALTARYGDKFVPEFEITGDTLSGHGDGYVAGDDVVVYELKTIRSLSKVRKTGPQDSHIKQAATYAVALKRQGFNVTEVRIVYFEKTNLDIQEFVVPYKPEWEQMVDDRIAELKPYMTQPDEHPACDGPKWLYPYCSFYPSCGRDKVYDGTPPEPKATTTEVTFQW